MNVMSLNSLNRSDYLEYINPPPLSYPPHPSYLAPSPLYYSSSVPYYLPKHLPPSNQPSSYISSSKPSSTTSSPPSTNSSSPIKPFPLPHPYPHPTRLTNPLYLPPNQTYPYYPEDPHYPGPAPWSIPGNYHAPNYPLPDENKARPSRAPSDQYDSVSNILKLKNIALKGLSMSFPVTLPKK